MAVQTQREWEEAMAKKILDVLRSELYLSLRYLDAALFALPWQANDAIQTFATDGGVLYFSAEQLLRLFRPNLKFLTRAYLHSVLHCIFRHLWLRGERNRECWDLSCDIAVESVIDGLKIPALSRPLSWTREKTYRWLREEAGVLAAAPIYRVLMESLDEASWRELRVEFYTDDHRFWPKEERESPSPQGKQWEQIGRQIEQTMQSRGDDAGDAETLLQTQIKAAKSRRSYREFLRKFAVLHEETHIDPDSFDLNFYTYGLSMYGNLPLIEPLESREVQKIREFVVVVDTSDSTSGELVKAFLKETFALLRQNDSFFHHTKIHLLQCDDAVRADDVVESTDELDRLLERFTLIGGGGTDFRPAFRYVDELIRTGALKELKGLLYFTDGKGIYPTRRPAYDAAFLFLGAHEEDRLPPWAMCLTLDPEELLPTKRRNHDQ